MIKNCFKIFTNSFISKKKKQSRKCLSLNILLKLCKLHYLFVLFSPKGGKKICSFLGQKFITIFKHCIQSLHISNLHYRANNISYKINQFKKLTLVIIIIIPSSSIITRFPNDLSFSFSLLPLSLHDNKPYI